ncbi:MAG TPA: beta-propeller fold lactonase family protein [Granulicella sp.]|jgi:6-phosphogluconolactonase|nr:beta-propeller fold lactonase family protein [Granulicella sp.]
MDWIKLSRRAMAPVGILAASLAMVSLTACTRDYTLAYMYVTSAKSSPGVVDQFAVDYQSGAVVEFGTPATAGNLPVASVAAPNAKSIYVVNQGDSTVQQFVVNGDGSLTPKTALPTGKMPTAVTINTAGTFLYVTYTNGFNTANPAINAITGFTPSSASTPNPPVFGGLDVFPINSDGSLGTATSLQTGVGPVGVTVSNFNTTVYVVDQGDLNPPAGTAVIPPYVQAFAPNAAGALAPVGPTTGYPAGVQPSAVAEDPTGRFVYVTDQAANQLIGYVVQAGGGLVAMVNGPFATGLYPVALTVDPRGLYIYVANYNARSISSYALNTANGAPSGVAGTTTTTDPNPVSVSIDPALGVYLYTANNLASTVSGQMLSANTGALTAIQNTPFPASGTPTSVALVANGSHPTELLQP